MTPAGCQSVDVLLMSNCGAKSWSNSEFMEVLIWKRKLFKQRCWLADELSLRCKSQAEACEWGASWMYLIVKTSKSWENRRKNSPSSQALIASGHCRWERGLGAGRGLGQKGQKKPLQPASTTPPPPALENPQWALPSAPCELLWPPYHG